VFILGFIGCMACSLGLVGLLVVITRPWRLGDMCDAALAEPEPQNDGVKCGEPLPQADVISYLPLWQNPTR